MKDIIKEISKWTSIIISVLMFAVACSDDKEDGAPEEPAPAAPTITDFVPSSRSAGSDNHDYRYWAEGSQRSDDRWQASGTYR